MSSSMCLFSAASNERPVLKRKRWETPSSLVMTGIRKPIGGGRRAKFATVVQSQLRDGPWSPLFPPHPAVPRHPRIPPVGLLVYLSNTRQRIPPHLLARHPTWFMSSGLMTSRPLRQKDNLPLITRRQPDQPKSNPAPDLAISRHNFYETERSAVACGLVGCRKSMRLWTLWVQREM